MTSPYGVDYFPFMHKPTNEEVMSVKSLLKMVKADLRTAGGFLMAGAVGTGVLEAAKNGTALAGDVLAYLATVMVIGVSLYLMSAVMYLLDDDGGSGNGRSPPDG